MSFSAGGGLTDEIRAALRELAVDFRNLGGAAREIKKEFSFSSRAVLEQVTKKAFATTKDALRDFGGGFASDVARFGTGVAAGSAGLNAARALSNIPVVNELTGASDLVDPIERGAKRTKDVFAPLARAGVRMSSDLLSLMKSTNDQFTKEEQRVQKWGRLVDEISLEQFPKAYERSAFGATVEGFKSVGREFWEMLTGTRRRVS
jgi:hypothetical protein